MAQQLINFIICSDNLTIMTYLFSFSFFLPLILLVSLWKHLYTFNMSILLRIHVNSGFHLHLYSVSGFQCFPCTKFIQHSIKQIFLRSDSFAKALNVKTCS
jgi:hypothetical protein